MVEIERLKDIKDVMRLHFFFEKIRELRNDSRVKSGFIEQNYITQEEHRGFMIFHSANFIIATVDNKFAGYAGVIDNDIRVCTHPDFQRMGIGKELINFLTIIYPHAKAVIKVDNLASQKLFESCGFGRKEEFYLYKKS